MLVGKWKACVEIAGGIIKDAVDTFKIEALKSLTVGQPAVKIKPLLAAHLPKKDQKSRKQSFMSQASGLKTNTSGAQSTTNKDEFQTNKSTTVHGEHKANQVATTALRYVKDIGLIVTTFDGQIKIFDAFNFFLVWRNSNKQRNPQQHTTISSFDVSPTLGLLATAGVEGRIVLFDPYAFGIINQTDATPNIEIIKLFIYSSQQQIISVSIDRTI